MLEKTSNYLSKAGITDFKTIQSPAEDIPLDDNSIDHIFAFNAIHHFNLNEFMDEAARILRDDGSIFIYTRLQSQNNSNIWGRYFPRFLEKEKRLYELYELQRMIKLADSLDIACTKGFKYRRKASLKRLIDLARNKHYSTFALYQKDEFEAALDGFEKNIKRHYSNLEQIEWDDEYTMLVVKKSG
jgi:ubiquinone/menaquinone biosynthesis C-methylase UbiE